MNTSIAINATNLSRDYGIARALNKVSLSVGSGRIVALLGPNGAGKTTLLKLLAGLIEPTEGQAFIGGVDSRKPNRDKADTSLACMIDGHEPPGWAIPRHLFNLHADLSPGFDRADAKRLLEQLGLPVNKPYSSMSKGQKRWVLATLCLAGNAQVLLLDEPAEGLDTKARRALYDAMRDHATEKNKTILVATHIIHDIGRIVDDVAVLRKGRLLLHEGVEELREQLCEIELPSDASEPSIEGAELIGMKRESGATIYWMRCTRDGRKSLEQSLDEKSQLRPVNLETLYLALTGKE